MLSLLPLLVAVLLFVLVVLVPFSRRVRWAFARVAVPLFGFYVANESPRRARQISRLRAAHVGTIHRVYAARTLLLSGLLGVVGSVFGVYAAAWTLARSPADSETLRQQLPASLAFLADFARLSELGSVELFALLAFFGGTVGAALALGGYWVSWRYLEQRAQARATEIEATLPRTVAFVYALSRSGMPFPTVLETLSRNRVVYGEAAAEFGVAVRDMEASGTDVLTALRRMATRTPSSGLEEFGENLASVLGSGRQLSTFLREQYERYQEEAASQQQQYLDLLATFAEVYVTVLVAGPLFFITVLVVIGLVIADTLPLLRIISYVGIPLASVAFVVYISSLTQSLRSPGAQAPPADTRQDIDATRATVRADGGSDANWRVARGRLRAYDRFRPVRRWLEHPVRSLLERPIVSVVVTVPFALGWVALSLDPAQVATGVARLRDPVTVVSGPTILAVFDALDEPLAESLVFVLGVTSLVYEVKKRRVRAIEDATPDFLDRMASVNEAGVSIVESLERVSGSDLRGLGPELERARRDIQWGADVATALRRLDARVRTPMVSRAVALITNAMDASGDIAPVLRIAAEEAQDTRRLRRERRQEMVTYLLVIYISFFVFLGIVVALTVAFIPAVEAATAGARAGAGASGVSQMSSSTFTGIREVDTDAYTLLFSHVSMIQALCSGLIAGQLGEGSVYDGLKHATVLLAFSYLLFAFL